MKAEEIVLLLGDIGNLPPFTPTKEKPYRTEYDRDLILTPEGNDRVDRFTREVYAYVVNKRKEYGNNKEKIDYLNWKYNALCIMRSCFKLQSIEEVM